MVWIKIINPIAKGWFNKNIMNDMKIKFNDKNIIISKNSL